MKLAAPAFSRAIYVAFALAATLLGMFGAFAEPNKEQYELQERCGIRAEEAFKADYGGGVTNTDEGQNITSYQNHYSTRLNKCFILVSIVSVNYKTQPQYISASIYLYDLSDHKEYGSFWSQSHFPVLCEVQRNICNSEREWQELLKPYMEE